MPKIIPPAPSTSDITAIEWNHFFELLRRYINQPPFFAKATDPVVADIPEGSYGVWYNTTSGQTRLWANVAGTLKSVLLT